MRTEYQCLECGSNKVQGKAWVSLNDNTDVDFSLLEFGDSEDYWCSECSEHTDVENITIYEEDFEVIWLEDYEELIYKQFNKKQ